MLSPFGAVGLRQLEGPRVSLKRGKWCVTVAELGAGGLAGFTQRLPLSFPPLLARTTKKQNRELTPFPFSLPRKNPKKRALLSSLTPKDLCSIQVREQALEINLRAPRGSPPSPLHSHGWFPLVRGVEETLVFMLL